MGIYYMENLRKNRRSFSVVDDVPEAETLLSYDRTEQIQKQNGETTSQNGTKFSEKEPKIPLSLRTARATMYVLIKTLNIAYVPVFIYRMFERRKKCTPVTDPILRIPAVELARRIRRKEISCQQVIQAYIDRIKAVNPLLNAIINERFMEALEEAKKVDELIASEDFAKDEEKIIRESPLLGIPVTIKGSLAVKDLKQTSGSLFRKDCIAKDDADAVALARKAGAIPLLASNVPELCMSWETTNKLIGTTRNPHDSRRTCGGSSGGEASLMGAGASLIGLGTDIAGSLRLPSHCCGVFGHKPTPGLVSYDGHYPSCPHRDQWSAVFTVGPMARYATDLRTLLEVISLPEKKKELDLHKMVNLKTLKVFYADCEDFYWKRPNLACKNSFQKVLDHFASICDRKPEKINLHFAENSTEIISLDILGIKDIDDTFDGNADGVWGELFRYTTCRSDRTFMAIATGVLRKYALSLSERQKTRIKNYICKLRLELQSKMDGECVIIMPTYPVEAPRHGDVLRSALYGGYMSIFNGLGFPVTNCPVGVTNDGLPIGIQIASLPYGDGLTIAVAEELEKAFGGWIEPKNT